MDKKAGVYVLALFVLIGILLIVYSVNSAVKEVCSTNRKVYIDVIHL